MDFRDSTASLAQTTSFLLDEALAAKVNQLGAYCREHGVKVSDGQVVRSLIEGVEPGPEFLGMVKVRREKEQAQRREKRRATLARKHARGPKTRG